MSQYMDNGFSFLDFVNDGLVPFQQYNQYKTAWYDMLNGKDNTVRNHFKNHEET